MKQKKIKLAAKTLFVYRSKANSGRIDPTITATTGTVTTTTHAFNK